MAELKEQIAQEIKELHDAPVIKAVVGSVKRCHICGQVFSATELKRFDEHVQGMNRAACPNCHPQRSLP